MGNLTTFHPKLWDFFLEKNMSLFGTRTTWHADLGPSDLGLIWYEKILSLSRINFTVRRFTQDSDARVEKKNITGGVCVFLTGFREVWEGMKRR